MALEAVTNKLKQDVEEGQDEKKNTALEAVTNKLR